MNNDKNYMVLKHFTIYWCSNTLRLQKIINFKVFNLSTFYVKAFLDEITPKRDFQNRKSPFWY